ncbi:FAD binding domain-containing protein [Euzebya tangerina]|uniref:FAD binding domain-containing protein n=1 Tax=Euzebya tangerina TaxID=591198 RepID=UPI0013C2ADB6|nr:xanthine dehydrogenase family protein subunit M [Euzebya tangerina]
MFPATYEYLRAGSIDEAVAALAEDPDETRILAGGQSLIPMMKLRFAYPERLVDINGLHELAYVRRENGHVAVGALARHADIVASDDVTGAVASAAPWVADPLVRNRGTLVGSVAHCDPEGDWNSVLLATGATVVAQGPNGRREIDITDFIVGLFENSLDEGEMVVEVRIPVPSGPSGGVYNKLERKIGDYATVGVATHLELADDGTIAAAGIGLTSVVPYATKVTEAEEMLVGQMPTEELFADAASATAAASNPHTDVRGTEKWKRNIVDVYTRRGLASALDQAHASEPTTGSTA